MCGFGVTTHPFKRKMQIVDLSGLCNKDVAPELTWTYSRVLINQQSASFKFGMGRVDTIWGIIKFCTLCKHNVKSTTIFTTQQYANTSSMLY